jgi:hypothetical protein
MAAFTKASVQALRAEINAALAAVAAKHDIKIHCGNASFSAGEVNFKVQALGKMDSGEVFSPELDMLKAIAPLYGLGDHVGKPFTIAGQTFILCGYKKTARTMPLLARGANGKGYKFSIEQVQRAFGINEGLGVVPAQMPKTF